MGLFSRKSTEQKTAEKLGALRRRLEVAEKQAQKVSDRHAKASMARFPRVPAERLDALREEKRSADDAVRTLRDQINALQGGE